MHELKVGSAQVKYTVTGSGPVLVLVHGVGKGAESAFGTVVDQFAQRNTVVLPDLSGSEAVEDDGDDLTMEMLAEQVSAVIADVDRGPVDLLGFSLGGSVVAATAAMYPEQVRRLIPVGGLVVTDAYMWNLIGLTLSLADRADAFGRVLSTTAFSPRFINELESMEEVDKLGAELSPSRGRLRQLELLMRVNISDLVGKIEAETLVVAPSPDAAVPTAHSRELATTIPNATYVEVDSGHMVLFEKPLELVKLVDEFIHRP